MINKLLGGLFGKVVDNAEGILDEVITTDEEREKVKLELKKIILEAEREAFAKEVEDRKVCFDLCYVSIFCFTHCSFNRI